MGGGPPDFQQDFSCLAVLRNPLALRLVSTTGLSPSSAGFSKTVPLPLKSLIAVHYPGDKSPVWALSLSLAATKEIDVSFSSYRYLDVSVPYVPRHTLWIGV